MIRNIKVLGVIAFILALGACERVKDKEAVAELPKTSTEDTLVFEPDSVEIDTTLIEREVEGMPEDEVEVATGETSTGIVGANSGNNGQNGAGSGTGSSVERKASGSVVSANAANTSTKSNSSKAVAAKPKYRRPTKKQLQQALAQDARLAKQMSLPRLRNYWLKRQNYYRRAARDIKYVAGDVKIKINTEETKIETPKGKVKIEGNDIKVKYD